MHVKAIFTKPTLSFTCSDGLSYEYGNHLLFTIFYDKAKNLAAFGLMKEFRRVTLHKHDVFSYLPHTAHGYHVLLFPAKYSKSLARPRYYYMGYTTLTQLEHQIRNTAHLLSVTYIYNFFMFKLTYTHSKNSTAS